MENKRSKQEETFSDEDEDDVVSQFLDKIQDETVLMFVTTGGLNTMCGTSLKGDGLIRVSPVMYWAYGELQLVWRDVLERFAAPKYKLKTITGLALHKANNTVYCTFTYNKAKFYAGRVGSKWTLCLTNEN